MSNTEQDILDLYDIALILNYERMSTEPRFRHAKLREVAFPGEELQTVPVDEDTRVDPRRPCTKYVFERPASSRGQIDMTSPPDLPSNMLPTDGDHPALETLTTKQLETIFHQARNHDGCFASVGLLQHFFDLFDPSTPLRIRHGPQGRTPGKVYTTTIGARVILEMTLVNPKFMTVSRVVPEGTVYTLGDDHTIRHATFGFAENPTGKIDSILDLSSLQFGDLGRGPGSKGQGLFALDTMDEFYDRLETIVQADSDKKTSGRIRSCPQDSWLREVAKRAKDRWDKRETEKWCGHCGAPRVAGTTNRCSGCQNAWYCDREHQNMAWPFHRHYCVKNQSAA